MHICKKGRKLLCSSNFCCGSATTSRCRSIKMLIRMPPSFNTRTSFTRWKLDLYKRKMKLNFCQEKDKRRNIIIFNEFMAAMKGQEKFLFIITWPLLTSIILCLAAHKLHSLHKSCILVVCKGYDGGMIEIWNTIIVNLNIQFRIGPRRNASSKDSSHLSVLANWKRKCSVIKKTQAG